VRTRAGFLLTTALRSTPMRIMSLATLVGFLVGGGLISACISNAALSSSCPNEALRTGPSAALPDCRAYEQVSPLNKNGFAAYGGGAPHVSSSGEALEYANLEAFPGAKGDTINAAHVSTRTGGGWQTTEWTPQVTKPAVARVYLVSYTFSPDLTQAILQVPYLPLTPEATPYVLNLFRGNATGEYSLIDSNPPAIPAEGLCEPQLLATTCWVSNDRSGFAGASNDFSHVLFESNAQFTADAPVTEIESLYENSAGLVHLVGILPDGKPAATSTAGSGSSAFYESSFTEADGNVERAMSQDGSHVIFQAPSDGGEPDSEQSGQTEVYDRINGTETIEISDPAAGAIPAVSTPEGATFQTASVDGSRVFFTSSAELTSSSNTGSANNSEDLYEYNLKTEQLNDLTVDANPADASTGAMVQGVVDASTDGSYVYFVANGQLVEGKGTDGQPNLYMVHDAGKPVFISTLSSEYRGCQLISDPCVWSPNPAEREAYVTPDGLHMAFISSKSLPTVNFPGGYDNTDQETGQADSEVYEYTAPAKPGGTGQLSCASCDPTGAQPVGKALIGGISPGINGFKSVNTSFYRVRALSDNGQRLFYAAPLTVEAPYDSVLEYEHDGEGTCENSRGCQMLISSGNTETDYFLGLSADGSNVYFATSSQLAPTDTDNLRDIYDARVDGGIPVSPEPLCTGNCRQPSGLPPAPLSPVSGLIGPSGNLSAPPPPPSPKKCKKGSRLSRGKCIKTKVQKKKSKRHGGSKARPVHAPTKASR
jgi:hypothetical protein